MTMRTSSPARARSKPSSHERILKAGKTLFAQRGYENTSTGAIARAAGTSESQLIKHFTSKEGLLEAVFDEGWEKLNQGARLLHELPSPAHKLRGLVDLVLEGLENDGPLKELMLLEGRRIRKEGHMVVLTQGFLEFIATLDGILTEMRDAGLLRGDVAVPVARSALIGILEGLLRDQLLAQRAGFPAPYSTADLRHMFEIVLEALTRRGAESKSSHPASRQE
ncbi:MAG: TetR/AcrR family transcriptional regulator [Terriglobales bacterium]